MRPATPQVLSAACLFVGCEAPASLPTQYETEHLRIGTLLDYPLCAGDLAAYEAIITRAEQELGMSMPATYDVSVWPDEIWPEVRSDYCGPNSLGCAHQLDRKLFTSVAALEHELVHAATPYAELNPFFAEGLADVYSGEQSRFGRTAPADNLDLSSQDVDRRTARHFVRWLRETWGATKLGELARHDDRAGERFADVYGISFGAAQAQFFEQAPYGYQGIDTCAGALLEPNDGSGRWQAAFEFDCAEAVDVRAIPLGLTTYRTFHIPAAGYYSVNTDAYAIDLSRCHRGAVEDAIEIEDYLDDDVPPSYSLDITENSATYLGGETLDLYFEQGEHRIGLLVLGHEPNQAQLAIWPALGPRPVGGE